MNKRILVLPGDGIGREVCDATLPILERLRLPIETMHGEIGWDCWVRDGDPVPQATWDAIARSDAVLLGAITSKPKAEAEAALSPGLRGRGIAFVSPVIQLRKRLGLYANVRPAYSIAGGRKPFRLSVVRENTEGLYAGFDYRGIPEPLRGLVSHPNLDAHGFEEASCTIRLQTRLGLERLFRFAFDHAAAQGFRRVTFADKPNVMRESGHFAREIFERVAADHPAIDADIHNVDATALWLVTRPEQFGVIVAENMFGDILSDLAGGVMGGLGLAPSGNYGDGIAYFEPVHGSAPAMQGRDRANPSAMALSISMMLDYLGFEHEAAEVQAAVATSLRRSPVRTYDMGGGAGTRAFADRIVAVMGGERLPKTAAIVAIGQELVEGEVQNTNAAAIAKHLTAAGHRVKEHLCLPDADEAIVRAIQRLLGDVDTILVCGGLGPTADDRTRHAVAAATGRELVHDEGSWAHVTHRMTRLGLQVREEDRVQALMPRGAHTIPNGNGLAYGFALEHAGSTLVVLPGPPREMLPMLAAAIPAEEAERPGHERLRWKLLGVIESEVQAFANGLDRDFAGRLRTIWQYPYLNLLLDVDHSDAATMAKVAELDAYLRPFTVGRTEQSASEMIGALPPAAWSAQDDLLRGVLGAFPVAVDGPSCSVETIPPLSEVMRAQTFTGRLEIRCTTPSGRSTVIHAPLRGPEVVDFVREYAAFSYLADSRAP